MGKFDWALKPHETFTFIEKRSHLKGTQMNSRAKADRAAVKAAEKIVRWACPPEDHNDVEGTPERMIKAFKEMLSGYSVEVDSLTKLFQSHSDEMIIVRNIEYTSVCQHHFLPFTGVAHVGYLPTNGMVIGLSKIPRIVDMYARRLQIQEVLTQQISVSVGGITDARGVGVVVTGKHQCLACRGARKPGAEMITSSMLGYFRERPEVRAEFLTLIKG